MNYSGPAFPFISGVDDDNTHYSGMSLRDYFAASISPMLFQHCWTDAGIHWEKGLAEMAYRIADAMLEEREKKL